MFRRELALRPAVVVVSQRSVAVRIHQVPAVRTFEHSPASVLVPEVAVRAPIVVWALFAVPELSAESGSLAARAFAEVQRPAE